MSDVTKIEYLDATWNPMTGCTHVSDGCRNCWAERMAKRHHKGWGQIYLHHERLEQPLHWRKPRRIGVCFMGDLFHENVPFAFQQLVFSVIRRAPRHEFFILTKRPQAMFEFLGKGPLLEDLPPGEFDHVWLGTSIENQKAAHERLRDLETLFLEGWNTWISLEPMLEPVFMPWLSGWVVCGGESGPGARPMEAEWAREVRDQCKAAGVPFFMKQMAKKAEIPEDLMIREFPGWFPS